MPSLATMLGANDGRLASKIRRSKHYIKKTSDPVRDIFPESTEDQNARLGTLIRFSDKAGGPMASFKKINEGLFGVPAKDGEAAKEGLSDAVKRLEAALITRGATPAAAATAAAAAGQKISQYKPSAEIYNKVISNVLSGEATQVSTSTADPSTVRLQDDASAQRFTLQALPEMSKIPGGKRKKISESPFSKDAAAFNTSAISLAPRILESPWPKNSGAFNTAAMSLIPKSRLENIPTIQEAKAQSKFFGENVLEKVVTKLFQTPAKSAAAAQLTDEDIPPTEVLNKMLDEIESRKVSKKERRALESFYQDQGLQPPQQQETGYPPLTDYTFYGYSLDTEELAAFQAYDRSNKKKISISKYGGPIAVKNKPGNQKQYNNAERAEFAEKVIESVQKSLGRNLRNPN